MSEAKFIIFATKNHPLYAQLKATGEKFIDLQSDEVFENKESRYLAPEAIFDFTLVDKESKYKLLKNLSLEYSAPIVSDLSCYWGDYFLGKFSKLKGALSTVFHSPTNKHEGFAQDEETWALMNEFIAGMNRTLHRVSTPGLGFIFPRTLALIINEAYFALEDGLASAQDLDTALKHGVNYPLGAIEWAKKCGPINVVMLLDELYAMTGDPRYRASLALRREASLL